MRHPYQLLVADAGCGAGRQLAGAESRAAETESRAASLDARLRQARDPRRAGLLRGAVLMDHGYR